MLKGHASPLAKAAIRAAVAVGVVWATVRGEAQTGPGTAIHFGGANAFVQGSSDSRLNAFPLSITAWVRTSRNTNEVDGLVTKYADASGNGYTVFLSNGDLHAWYFRDSSGDRVFPTSQGIDGGFIADGNWHHIAFVVDQFGGRTYIDGTLTASAPWTGTAGATTSAQSLQVGQYVTVGNTVNSFIGDLDEITLWKRALSGSEVNYLKHRQLSGLENGLLSYWRCDESAGPTIVDTSNHGLAGTLQNGAARVPSGAVIVLNPVATNCLNLDGAGGYASAANNSDLDVLPLTVMAWVNTGRNAAQVDGIVSMYQDASFSGYSLHLLNGHVRAWYFADFGDSIFDGSEGLDGGFIADTNWHHITLVVDTNGGRLIVDGNQKQSLGWNGTPTPTTTGQPLQIGRYSAFANTFQGQLDEVSIWNRSFSTNEIQSQMNLPLAGNESGLVAYWRLDEGNGTSATDSANKNHTITLQSTATWTGSTAFLGDGSVHLLESVNYVNVVRPFAINGSPGQAAFGLNTGGALTRIYDYGTAPVPESVAVHLDTSLQTAPLGSPIQLQPNTTGLTNTIGAYLAAGPIGIGAAGGRALINASYNAQLASGIQLDSVDNLEQFTVTLSHSENGGPFSNDATNSSDATRLLQFDGNLFFGPILTLFSNIDSTPVVSAVVPGDHLDCTLAVSQDAGLMPSAPGHTYGDGTVISVSLQTNGDAIAKSGTTVAVHGPTKDIDSIQNISFTRGQVTLGNTSASGFVSLTLPTGFSVGSSPSNHFTLPILGYPNTQLDASLRPIANSLTTTGPLYAVVETLPYWFAAPSLSWNVSGGQITLTPTGGQFARQAEDDLLASLQATLIETNAANRVSNDGYFRNAQAGGTLIIIADANGVARVTTQLALNPPELRPHFPYSGSAPGDQISTDSGGMLIVTNSLVDPANSFLNVGSAVPVSYHQDCEEPTSCSASQIVPATLLFSPTIPGQLGFTPDGGVLSYGAVAATELAWGYVSGTNFAQRAGSVQAGAYCMAGTFLRGDQSLLAAPQLPAALLFSGFGDASDPSYLERPGYPNYITGAANYAGLNFRSPAAGQSYLAKQDTGPYPLAPVSKYYIRFGGVSGIHQCPTGAFPQSNLSLYGYNFRLTSYALSFLDSENWESRTDGGIAFPAQPAGFTQEFGRMKLTCRGDLSSATIPAGTGTKHLNYWNVDFTPLSMDFHGASDDVCNASNRFLVLGVEATLPFISQALHAALGFKTNGDLVTPADAVQGIDSRFPVPAQLSLKGPVNTTFTLSTSGQGYFNNWETAGRPDAGFYNLVGKLRVPFFTDIKTHLHITPIGPTTSQVNIMGGWPAADSTAADLGWSVNQQNFFNTRDFDAHSDGWPASLGVSLSDYRDPSGTQFRPRAQRDWLEVAFFDYPLQWNDMLHNFAGFQPAKVVLPIIDVNSRLRELAPGKVDLDFAQDISLQLPRIKALDFVNDALDGNIGPLITVSNVIRQQLGSALDASGLNELSQTLREDAKSFFDPVLQPVIGPAAQALYSQFFGLISVAQTNEPLFLQQVYQIVSTPAGILSNAFSSINGAAGQVDTVVGKLDKTLTDVQDTLGLFDRALDKDSDGNRHVINVIVEKLVADQSQPLLGAATSLGDSIVNPLIVSLDPTLTEIQSDLEDVSNQIAEVHTQLTGAAGDFNQALSGTLSDTTSLGQFVQSAAVELTNYLATVLTPAGDYLTADAAAVQAALRQELETAFLSSALPGNYQNTFRQFLYDKDFLLNQIMNDLFDQINRAIRDGLSSKITGAQDGLFGNLKGAGLLTQSLLAAKIRGSPTFDADSLRNIHLDAAIQMNLPDKMSFNAYLDIKELDSQSVPLSCIPAGAPAAEVTLGAKNVPLNWVGVNNDPGSPSLLLDLDAKWTLQNGAVLGIGGSLGLHGGPAFEGCSLKDIGATLAFGPTENYFAARADASVIVLAIPVDFKAGIFVGQACTLDPIQFVDPDCTNVLLNNPQQFSGVYVQYGGGLSLSDLLLGSSTCFLDVEAGISTALYYEGGAALGIIGGRQKTSVDLSLLCVLKGHADWAEFLALDTSGQLTLGGSAQVCGALGPCPLCVSGCKSITVKGVLKRGGVDYFIDY